MCMTAGGQSLLPGLLPPSAAQAAGRGWLSAEAALFTALESSATLRSVLRDAALAAKKLRGTRGAFGERFEAEVALLLTEEIVQSIEADVLAVAPSTSLGVLTGLTMNTVEGIGPVDLFIGWRFASGLTHESAVNIKTLSPEASGFHDAVSLPAFLYHLTEPALATPWREAVPRGWSAHTALTEMAEGVRKIQKGRSYWVLVATIDFTATLCAVYTHGLVSQLAADGSLPISRNASRDGVMSGMPAMPIPDGYDINAAVVEALLPRRSVDSLRVLLIALLTSVSEPEARAAVAATVNSMSDEELLESISSGIFAGVTWQP
jgi:hypothetical protein